MLETFSSKPVVPVVDEYRAVVGSALALYFESTWLESPVGRVTNVFCLLL